MNFQAMFNQMNQPTQNNTWEYIRDVSIPQEEGYTRNRHFEMGYETRSANAKYFNNLIGNFIRALQQRCTQEGIFFQHKRIQGGGIECYLEREVYMLYVTDRYCSWQYLGKAG
jgi:hypothetical protein